ncbi:unnamed protein product, partial [Durusdinium trenchii]
AGEALDGAKCALSWCDWRLAAEGKAEAREGKEPSRSRSGKEELGREITRLRRALERAVGELAAQAARFKGKHGAVKRLLREEEMLAGAMRDLLERERDARSRAESRAQEMEGLLLRARDALLKVGADDAAASREQRKERPMLTEIVLLEDTENTLHRQRETYLCELAATKEDVRTLMLQIDDSYEQFRTDEQLAKESLSQELDAARLELHGRLALERRFTLHVGMAWAIHRWQEQSRRRATHRAFFRWHGRACQLRVKELRAKAGRNTMEVVRYFRKMASLAKQDQTNLLRVAVISNSKRHLGDALARWIRFVSTRRRVIKALGTAVGIGRIATQRKAWQLWVKIAARNARKTQLECTAGALGQLQRRRLLARVLALWNRLSFAAKHRRRCLLHVSVIAKRFVKKQALAVLQHRMKQARSLRQALRPAWRVAAREALSQWIRFCAQRRVDNVENRLQATSAGLLEAGLVLKDKHRKASVIKIWSTQVEQTKAQERRVAIMLRAIRVLGSRNQRFAFSKWRCQTSHQQRRAWSARLSLQLQDMSTASALHMLISRFKLSDRRLLTQRFYSWRIRTLKMARNEERLRRLVAACDRQRTQSIRLLFERWHHASQTNAKAIQKCAQVLVCSASRLSRSLRTQAMTSWKSKVAAMKIAQERAKHAADVRARAERISEVLDHKRRATKMRQVLFSWRARVREVRLARRSFQRLAARSQSKLLHVGFGNWKTWVLKHREEARFKLGVVVFAVQHRSLERAALSRRWSRWRSAAVQARQKQRLLGFLTKFRVPGRVKDAFGKWRLVVSGLERIDEVLQRVEKLDLASVELFDRYQRLGQTNRDLALVTIASLLKKHQQNCAFRAFVRLEWPENRKRSLIGCFWVSRGAPFNESRRIPVRKCCANRGGTCNG